MDDKSLENPNVDGFEIYARRAFIIEKFLQKQNCKFHKLKGLTRKQGYKKCPCNLKNYDKINNNILL